MNCKECSKGTSHRHREDGKPAVYCSRKCNEKAIKRRQRERFQAWLLKHKSKPCMDCNKSFPAYCMDFDHRPGEHKEFDLGRATFIGLTRRELEIAKCDLVCACCHRIRTYSRTHSSR